MRAERRGILVGIVGIEEEGEEAEGMMMIGEQEEDLVPVQDHATEGDVVTGEAILVRGPDHQSVLADVPVPGLSQETNDADTDPDQTIDTVGDHILVAGQMIERIRRPVGTQDRVHQK